MTVADAPTGHPRLEQWPLPDRPGLHHRAQVAVLEPGVSVFPTKGVDLREVLVPQRLHRLGRAERGDLRARLGRGMERDHHLRHLLDHLPGQRTRGEQPVHHPVLGKPAHLDRELHRLSAAAHHQPTRGLG